MAVDKGTIKLTVPRWRVRVCLAVLWVVAKVVPGLARRDRLAELLAPRMARWIAAGLRQS